jgi:hypothetical protein
MNDSQIGRHAIDAVKLEAGHAVARKRPVRRHALKNPTLSGWKGRNSPEPTRRQAPRRDKWAARQRVLQPRTRTPASPRSPRWVRSKLRRSARTPRGEWREILPLRMGSFLPILARFRNARRMVVRRTFRSHSSPLCAYRIVARTCDYWPKPHDMRRSTRFAVAGEPSRFPPNGFLRVATHAQRMSGEVCAPADLSCSHCSRHAPRDVSSRGA